VALALEPNNGEYERALGWAIFEGGQKPDGLAHLYRALELSPRDVNILTDLGMAMLLLGNLDKAKEYGNEAVAINPGHDLARKLLEDVHHLDQIRKKRR
jgi:tetratricopeptide (TPR) repeat protein